MYDIGFEKAEGHGGTVNRTSVYAEASIRRVLEKRRYDKFRKNSQESICARISFLVFSCKFCEICKNTVFTEQHWKTASDYTNINIVAIGALGNETVNFGTKN